MVTLFKMKTNQEFKRAALDALRGHWGKAVVTTLLYILLLSAISGPAAYTSYMMQEQINSMVGRGYSTSIFQAANAVSTPEFIALQQRASRTSSLTSLLQFLILMPLSIGFVNAFKLLFLYGDDNLLTNSLQIAFRGYWRNVWAMLLMSVLIVLWSLLLIIPGIIKAFSYSMTQYILHDNPELTASEAIHRSRMMMRGHKFDLFWLYLGFLGWFILCLMTAGIGFIWLAPYVETAKVAFYQEVKADYALNGGLD